MDASAWDERYAAAEHVWSLGPNQFVEAELADLPPGRALDLACGEGRNAIWLARRGWQVTALDFSRVGVERGRVLAGDLDIDWRVGDVLTEPLPAADLVVLAYLQLTEAERRTAVRRAFGALTSGGTLLLVAHDSTNLTEGTGGPQDPAVLYTADDVLADLAGTDHQVVRAERVPRRVVGDDDHGGAPDATAWDALVRVVRR
jgi:SAM-dependent methyltransferase